MSLEKLEEYLKVVERLELHLHRANKIFKKDGFFQPGASYGGAIYNFKKLNGNKYLKDVVDYQTQVILVLLSKAESDPSMLEDVLSAVIVLAFIINKEIVSNS